VKKTNRTWSQEAVLQDALKYQSRSAWKAASYGYECANNNGWIEIACKHMKGGKGIYQKGYWTLEKCLLDAKKYKTKSDWRYSQVPSGYVVAKRNGWLQRCCEHMQLLKKPNGYWRVLENCLKDAAGYKTIKNWEENSPAAVSSARKNKWMASCVHHMETGAAINRKWNKVLVLKDAAKYSTIAEWRRMSPSAYRFAQRNKFLEEATVGMSSVVSLGEYQITKFLLERNVEFQPQKRFQDCKDKSYLPFDFYLPRFNLLIEFQGTQHLVGFRRDKNDAKRIAKRDAIKKSYARTMGFEFLEIWNIKDVDKGLTEKLNAIWKKNGGNLRLMKRVLSQGELSTLLTLGIWTLDKCKKDAKKYATKSDWAKNSAGAHSVAYKNEWVTECCNHMEVLWKKKWTLDACKADASIFRTKNEWQKNSRNGYSAAYKNNWLTACCVHMEEGRKPNGYWSLARCQQDARRFKTKLAWHTNSPSGYATARVKGWIADCCSHMSISRVPNGYWTLERCIVVAKSFKTKKTWRLSSASSYAVAKNKGWLKHCDSHMA